MKKPLQVTKVLARIESIEAAIRKAKEYLESGEHAHWGGFRPRFNSKVKDGVALPPHKDWVKNVYLRHMERSLVRAEKKIWQLERENSSPSGR
jgi:hypothetical protein